MSNLVNVPMELIKVIIPGLIAFWAGKRTSLQSKHLETTKEVFYRFYLPAFKILEPNLYSSCTKLESTRTSEELYSLIQENYEFIKGQDVNLIRKFRSEVLKYEDAFYENVEKINPIYQELCLSIDKEFERLRRRLGLPTRTLYDKLNSGKISSSLQFKLSEMVRYIENLSPLIYVFALFILGHSFINLLLNFFK